MANTENTRASRKATGIEWDTDGMDPAECGLPAEVEIPDDVDDSDVGNWLSDTYGFCHNGYVLEGGTEQGT